MKNIKELWKKYREIIMYLIMGVATTVVNWIIYAICIRLITIDGKLLNMDLDILISGVIAWIVAIIFAFVTNKSWVFSSKSWETKIVVREFVEFVVARLITGIIEWFGTPLLVAIGLNQTIFGVKGMISKIIVSVIVIILNYVFSKLVVFKKRDN